MIKCPYCKNDKHKKDGLRKTDNRGKLQRYKCKACNRRFTNDEGFYRMRNSPEKITQALDLYFGSMSSRKIRNYFRRHLPHNASHITILDWARRYSIRVQNHLNTLKPTLSGEFYVDETLIDRCRIDGRKDVFWCSIDWETRYINATHYSPMSQNLQDGRVFLEKIKQSKKLPQYITTDGLQLYPRLMRKVFSVNKNAGNRTEHHIINASKTGIHNVKIETVFSKIKDRTRNFRGLKQLWSAPILMNGIIIQHNLVEEHTTTEDIPSSRAGLRLGNKDNRWLELIKLASKQD